MSRLLVFPLLLLTSLSLLVLDELVAQDKPPPKAEAKKGRKIAVLVGVNGYANKPFDNLKFAERDMIDLKAKLEKAGFEVILLLGSADGPTEASRTNIAAVLLDAREENLRFAFRKIDQESDQILVAFSGHGEQIEVEEDDGDGKRVKREVPHFCPKRAETGKPSTQVSLNDVLKVFQNGKAKSLLLVDACRVYSSNKEGTKGAVLDRKRVDVLRPNVGGMFAASDRQAAREHEKVGHGLFFAAVLNAMDHEKSRDDDGNVVWANMTERIGDLVQEHSKACFPALKYDEHQVPFAFNAPRKFVLGAGAVAPPKPKDNPIAIVPGGPTVDPPTGPAPPLLTVWPFAAEDAKKAQAAWAKHLGVKVEEEIRLSDKATMKLVLIPPGQFRMGSPQASGLARADEKPERLVTISKPFFLGATEVTQNEYRAVTGVNRSVFDGKNDNKASGQDTGRFPVENVNASEAEAFCAEVGARLRKSNNKAWKAATGVLPTEAQFEWACRAGTDTDHAAELPRVANTKEVEKGARAEDRTTAVGDGKNRPANAFGLFDMHGNVAEWCRDFYDPNFYKNAPAPDTDPLQARTAFKDRVVRGGSWLSTARESRSAARRGTNPESKGDEIGFRVCITIAP